MRSKYIFQVLFVITLFSQGAKAQDIDLTIDRIVQSECRSITEDRYVGRNLLVSNYDVISYRMNWSIDPAVRFISGTVDVFFKRTDNSLQMELDLSDSLHVDEVSVQSQMLLFEHSDNTLRIHLNGNSAPGILDSVKITYNGIPTNTGFGSFNQSEHEGVPIIWTLSEPYGASDWWPCKMGNEDKADSIDVSITVPNGFRAAGNGLLVNEQIIGASTVYHWQHKYPIAAYLIFLAVTNYEAYTNMVTVGNTTFPVLNYAYPEELDYWQDQSKNIVPIFDNYHQLITPYPFKDEKYGHARFGWGGGMEHQTMSSMVSLDFGLMAHELAHQWFGNSITCGSWQDIWLNEGFATYMTGLSYEHLIDG
ncbi:MAG: M1 family aminopeptidase, partial [Saprospiraceae bacterium]